MQTEGCEIVGCQSKRCAHLMTPITDTCILYHTTHIVNSLLFRYAPFLQVLSQQKNSLHVFIQVEKLFLQNVGGYRLEKGMKKKRTRGHYRAMTHEAK